MKINDKNQGKNNIFFKARKTARETARTKKRGGRANALNPHAYKKARCYFFILRMRFIKRREGLETAFISDEDVEPSNS